jgi:hypothetical protein
MRIVGDGLSWFLIICVMSGGYDEWREGQRWFGTLKKPGPGVESVKKADDIFGLFP